MHLVRYYGVRESDSTAQGGHLEYNPYAVRYEELRKSISSAEEDRSKWKNQLDWYESFDEEAAFAELTISKRNTKDFQSEADGMPFKVSNQASTVVALKESASLGFDPRYWFSSERSVKKGQLVFAQQALARLIQQGKELQRRIRTGNSRVDELQAELNRHRGFDVLGAEAAIKGLTSHLAQLNSELIPLRVLKDKVDGQLFHPLAELIDLQRRNATLWSEIDKAEILERRLTAAANGYARKMIHDECRLAFGDDKPAKVMATKRREAESVARNIGKLQERLHSISQRASRTIKTLVIDGNNLCYQHQSFIGISAVRAVAGKLRSDCAVVVIFDATIRRKLQMNDRDIAGCFGEAVKVHVVGSGQKADETVLDAATDPDTYVISNDRFADFPEKPAVRDKRLIRHEILNGKVFVHDLNVAEVFLPGT